MFLHRGDFLTGKTHAVLGTAAALAVSAPANVYELAAVIGVSAFSSLLPDLDVKSSRANKLLNTVVLVWGLVILGAVALDRLLHFGLNDILLSCSGGIVKAMRPFGAGALLLYFAVLPFSGHRGFTHSIAALFISAAFACTYLSRPAAAAFAAGYAVHIFADLFNKKGEQLLFPAEKRYCLKLCKSDGIVSKSLFLLGSMVSGLEIIGWLVAFAMLK